MVDRAPPHRALSHQESLAKVCAVCTNLRGEKGKRRVREVEVELIRKHVHPGYLLDSEIFPQGVCTKCSYDLKLLERGQPRTLTLPDDYTITLPRSLRSSPKGPCECRYCALARLQGPQYKAWKRTLGPERREVSYLCTDCGRGVGRGEARHTCRASDMERVEAMVEGLPKEIRNKLTCALLRKAREEQGAGDGRVVLPQHAGGQPTTVHVGGASSSRAEVPAQLSHLEVQTMASNAHLTGGQVKSVLADMRATMGRSVVEKGLMKGIAKLNKRFEGFFTCERMLFLDKNNQPVTKPLFYSTKTLEFLKLVAENRGQDWDKVKLFIQGDSGQGWFKLAVSLLDPEEEEEERGRRTRAEGVEGGSRFASHGVRKILILALVSGVPENSHNLDVIFRWLGAGVQVQM